LLIQKTLAEALSGKQEALSGRLEDFRFSNYILQARLPENTMSLATIDELYLRHERKALLLVSAVRLTSNKVLVRLHRSQTLDNPDSLVKNR
jgi:hypothetical protein